MQMYVDVNGDWFWHKKLEHQIVAFVKNVILLNIRFYKHIAWEFACLLQRGCPQVLDKVYPSL